MIAFGCSITSQQTYNRLALPGLRLCAEPDTVILAEPSLGNPFLSYNAILDNLSGEDDLEAVVFIHQDLEITDPAFCAKVRHRFSAEPDIGVIGIAGARGVRSMAWWEGDEILGSWNWRYDEDGGGLLDAREWDTYVPQSATGCHEVDSVDGILIALSPWAASALRFDQTLGPSAHGWDADICMQARAAGRRVAVDELGAVHHHDMEVLRDPSEWVDAYVKFERKWAGRKPGGPQPHEPADCEERALRAEAEAAVARVERGEMSMRRNEAEKRFRSDLAWRDQQLDELRTAYEAFVGSTSWRYTAPLRALSARLRRRR